MHPSLQQLLLLPLYRNMFLLPQECQQPCQRMQPHSQLVPTAAAAATAVHASAAAEALTVQAAHANS
jgi:hypothetical protein